MVDDRMKMNKRSQIISHIIVGGFLLAFITFMYYAVIATPNTDQAYIGENQLAMLRTGMKAENDLLYVDQAAKIAAIASIVQLAQQGGLHTFDEDTFPCGDYYGYPLLHAFIDDELKNCFIDDLKPSIKDMMDAQLSEIYSRSLSSQLKGYNINYDYIIDGGIIKGIAGNPLDFNIVIEQEKEITEEVEEKEVEIKETVASGDLFEFTKQFIGLPYVFGGGMPPANEPWKTCGDCIWRSCHEKCMEGYNSCSACIKGTSASSAWKNECKAECSDKFVWNLKDCYPSVSARICPKGEKCDNGCRQSSFDCSGLMQYIHKEVYDISIGRSTRQQYQQCGQDHPDYTCEYIGITSAADMENLQPGDLLYWNKDGSKASSDGKTCVKPGTSIHHVALYIGKENGQYRTYEAKATNIGVVKGVISYKNSLCGAIRIRPKNMPKETPGNLGSEPFILIEGDMDEKASSKLYLISDGKLVKEYTIGIGKGGMGKTKKGDEKTPIGTYQIKWKASRFADEDGGYKIEDGKAFCGPGSIFTTDPKIGYTSEQLWTNGYAGDKAVVMGLDYPNSADKAKGYTGGCIEVHSSVYKTEGLSSLGCPRMEPDDARELYKQVKVGTKVIIEKGPIDINKYLQEAVSPEVSGKKIVVIDPGHGTKYNVRPAENQIVLSVGMKLKDLLEKKGITAYMTRTSVGGVIEGMVTGKTGVEYYDNAARADFANKKNADLVIRLHSNSGTANGFFLMYPEANKKCTPNAAKKTTTICKKITPGPSAEIAEASKKASQIISDTLESKGIPKEKGPVTEAKGTGSGFNLMASVNLKVPATLIEMYGHGSYTGSSSTYKKYKANTDRVQDKMAEALAEGIVSYLGTSSGVTKPTKDTTEDGTTENEKAETKIPKPTIEMSDAEKTRVDNTNKYNDLIIKYAEQYSVPPQYVSAMISWESGGRPDAISYTGCVGLGQFCYGTAAGDNYKDIFGPVTSCACGGSGQPACKTSHACNAQNDGRFNPEKSVEATAKYLGSTYKAYDGNVYLMAIAYNAGGAVAKDIQNMLGDKTGSYDNIKELLEPAIRNHYSPASRIQSKTKEADTHMRMVARMLEIFGGQTNPATETEIDDDGTEKTFLVRTLGKYTVYPSFSITMGYNFDEYDQIKEQSLGKGTQKGILDLVADCEKHGNEIEKCVAEAVKTINERPEMKENKLELFNGPCDPKENLWSDLVEDFGDCVDSKSTDCYCALTLDQAEQSESDEEVKIEVKKESGTKISVEGVSADFNPTAPITSTEIEVAKIIEEESDKWYNTPYKMGSSTPGKGIDCSGWVYYLVNRIREVKGLDKVSTTFTHGNPNHGPYAEEWGDSRWVRMIDESDLRPGDIILLDRPGTSAKHWMRIRSWDHVIMVFEKDGELWTSESSSGSHLKVQKYSKTIADRRAQQAKSDGYKIAFGRPLGLDEVYGITGGSDPLFASELSKGLNYFNKVEVKESKTIELNKKSAVYYLNKKGSEISIEDKKPENTEECNIKKRKFKFCMMSGQPLAWYDSNAQSIRYENIKYNFALEFTDKISPPTVTNLQAKDKEKAESSIIIEWDAPKEKQKIPADLDYYLVYCSQTGFVVENGNPVVAGIKEPLFISAKDSQDKLKEHIKAQMSYCGGDLILDNQEYNIAVIPVDVSENKGKAVVAKAMSKDDLAPGSVIITVGNSEYESHLSTFLGTGENSVDVLWERPDKNEDGKTEADDIEKYWVYALQGSPDLSGCTAGCTEVIEADKSRTIEGLTVETAYNIAVVAVDAAGNHITSFDKFTEPEQWKDLDSHECYGEKQEGTECKTTTTTTKEFDTGMTIDAAPTSNDAIAAELGQDKLYIIYGDRFRSDGNLIKITKDHEGIIVAYASRRGEATFWEDTPLPQDAFDVDTLEVDYGEGTDYAKWVRKITPKQQMSTEYCISSYVVEEVYNGDAESDAEVDTELRDEIKTCFLIEVTDHVEEEKYANE